MNIFYTDTDPFIAAINVVDKHSSKMVLETAQLLSTAHRLLDGEQKVVSVTSKNGTSKKKIVYVFPDEREDVVYSVTHKNHPSAIWARESRANYEWLFQHFIGLGNEFSYRYGKQHLSITKLEHLLKDPPLNLKAQSFTKMPSCMDPQYIISSDPVINYRNYYGKGKVRLHKWTKRNPPDWIEQYK